MRASVFPCWGKLLAGLHMSPSAYLFNTQVPPPWDELQAWYLTLVSHVGSTIKDIWYESMIMIYLITGYPIYTLNEVPSVTVDSTVALCELLSGLMSWFQYLISVVILSMELVLKTVRSPCIHNTSIILNLCRGSWSAVNLWQPKTEK